MPRPPQPTPVADGIGRESDDRTKAQAVAYQPERPSGPCRPSNGLRRRTAGEAAGEAEERRGGGPGAGLLMWTERIVDGGRAITSGRRASSRRSAGVNPQALRLGTEGLLLDRDPLVEGPSTSTTDGHAHGPLATLATLRPSGAVLNERNCVAAALPELPSSGRCRPRSGLIGLRRK